MTVEKIKRTKIRQILDEGKSGDELCAKGWVRTKRESKNVAFVALNDGSTIKNLQLVLDVQSFDEDLLRKITTGASLSVNGKLAESQGAGQAVELLVDSVEFIAAPSVPGEGALADVSTIHSVNGHSLGGYLATSFARLFGGQWPVGEVNTYNSAGFLRLASSNIEGGISPSI